MTGFEIFIALVTGIFSSMALSAIVKNLREASPKNSTDADATFEGNVCTKVSNGLQQMSIRAATYSAVGLVDIDDINSIKDAMLKDYAKTFLPDSYNFITYSKGQHGFQKYKLHIISQETERLNKEVESELISKLDDHLDLILIDFAKQGKIHLSK